MRNCHLVNLFIMNSYFVAFFWHAATAHITICLSWWNSVGSISDVHSLRSIWLLIKIFQQQIKHCTFRE